MSKGEGVFQPETLRALRDPILDKARGLPASVYTSQTFFELEQERLFPKTWMGIAFDSDVLNRGDAVPLTVQGLPLILVRDNNNNIRGKKHDVPKKAGFNIYHFSYFCF